MTRIIYGHFKHVILILNKNRLLHDNCHYQLTSYVNYMLHDNCYYNRRRVTIFTSSFGLINQTPIDWEMLKGSCSNAKSLR